MGFSKFGVTDPQVIFNALSVGYRHFDLAQTYNNNLQHVRQGLSLAFAPLSKGGIGIERKNMRFKFYATHLTRLLKVCQENNWEKPFANEIQINPYVYCPKKDIAPTMAYSPLGFNAAFIILQDDTMQSIAGKIGITTAQ